MYGHIFSMKNVENLSIVVNIELFQEVITTKNKHQTYH